MMERELPEGWVEATFEEINLRKSKSIDPGLTPDKTFELYSVPIFESGLPEIVNGEQIKSSKQIVEQGEVLVCKINPRINRVWEVGNFTNYQKIASSEWMVVNTNNIINSSFLRYQFSAPFFRSVLQSEVSGVGGSLTRARPKIVDSYAVKLAPLAEQERIVAKLDAAFAHVETLKTSLARIPELLKKFRQTVLTQAVTGKLTETDRITKLFPVWSTKKLSLISEKITVGYVGKMSDEYKESGIPFLRSQNIRAFRYSSNNLLYISEEFHNKIKKSILKPGDVAIVRSGYPGTTCVIPENIIEANCSDILILTPKKDLLNPFYVSIFMNSEFGKELVFHGKVGNAQQHFNTKTLQNTEIPLPPLEEQQEIVSRVEALFAKADVIEAQYQRLKEKIDKLPQALLAKAFRGELVPQDPNDEPASVLLEKIQSATEKLTKKSKKQMSLAFEQE